VYWCVDTRDGVVKIEYQFDAPGLMSFRAMKWLDGEGGGSL
jgi:hypothetical protein